MSRLKRRDAILPLKRRRAPRSSRRQGGWLMMLSGGAGASGGGGSGSPSYTATHYVEAYDGGAGPGTSDFDTQTSGAFAAAAASNETPVPCTIWCALTYATAGDMVQLAPGLYVGNPNPAVQNRFKPRFRPANNGTSGNPIIFFAENPAATNLGSPSLFTELTANQATLPANPQPTFGCYGETLQAEGQEYIIWDGIYVSQENGAHPFHGQCSLAYHTLDVEIRRCVFDRTETGGGDQFCAINLESATDVRIVDCVFRGGSSNPPTGPSSHNDGAITIYSGYNFLIEYCKFMRNEADDSDMGQSIFVKGDKGGANGNHGVIRYCWMEGQIYSSDDGIMSLNYADGSAGGVEVYQNVMWKNWGGISVRVDGTELFKSFNIHHNTIVDTRANDGVDGMGVFTFREMTLEDELTVRDNIVAHLLDNNANRPLIATEVGVDLDECIDFDNQHYFNGFSNPVWNIGVDVDGGTQYTSLETWQAQWTDVDANATYGDPLFEDYANGDLRLQTGSPCLTGASVGNGPRGAYITGSEEIGVRANPTY